VQLTQLINIDYRAIDMKIKEIWAQLDLEGKTLRIARGGNKP